MSLEFNERGPGRPVHLRIERGFVLQVRVLAQHAHAAHDEAVTLFEQFSTEGEESALRDFAAETLPTLKEHQTEIHEMTGD